MEQWWPETTRKYVFSHFDEMIRLPWRAATPMHYVREYDAWGERHYRATPGGLADMVRGLKEQGWLPIVLMDYWQ